MPFSSERMAKLAPLNAVVKNTGPSGGTASVAEQIGVVTILNTPPPTASAPTQGLPADAKPGHFYTFATNPSTIYTLGSDYVWRAIPLVPVV